MGKYRIKWINVLILFLITFLFAFVVYIGMTLLNKPSEQAVNDIVVVEEENTQQVMNFMDASLETYDFYEVEDKDYNFYMATFTFVTDEKFKIDNSKIYTSENQYLSEANQYTIDLRKDNYIVPTEKIKYDVEDAEYKVTATLFIPVISNNDISVYFDIDEESFIFDLEYEYANKVVVEKSEENSSVIANDVEVDDNFSFSVLQVLDITSENIYYRSNDVRYQEVLPSTVSVFAVQIEVKLANNPITITDANYVIDDKVFSLLNDKYEFDNYLEIYNTEITKDQTGYLLFEIFEAEPTMINQLAELRLRLSDDAEYTVIKINDAE